MIEQMSARAGWPANSLPIVRSLQPPCKESVGTACYNRSLKLCNLVASSACKHAQETLSQVTFHSCCVHCLMSYVASASLHIALSVVGHPRLQYTSVLQL